MNEMQYDALSRRDSARATVTLKTAELREAKRVLRIRQRQLNEAIFRDKRSWESTPGVERYA